MSTRLIDLASVIRSKNAGPGELTLDVIFKTREAYDRVVAEKLINKALIARLYGQRIEDVLSVIAFEPAWAIKATMRRPTLSGAVGDTDIYGAQQHAPLLGLEFENY